MVSASFMIRTGDLILLGKQSGTEVKLDEGFDPNLGFRIAVRALDNDAVVKRPEFHRRSFLRPAHSAAMPSIWAVWHSKDRSAKK